MAGADPLGFDAGVWIMLNWGSTSTEVTIKE